MSTSVNNQPDRLYSLDALRGFDMFWIMGAEEIFHQLSKATGSPFWGAVSNQLTHPEWNGFAMYDLIFPLFLFTMTSITTGNTFVLLIHFVQVFRLGKSG